MATVSVVIIMMIVMTLLMVKCSAVACCLGRQGCHNINIFSEGTEASARRVSPKRARARRARVRRAEEGEDEGGGAWVRARVGVRTVREARTRRARVGHPGKTERERAPAP